MRDAVASRSQGPVEPADQALAIGEFHRGNVK